MDGQTTGACGGRRVIALGLDGFDLDYARTLVDAGLMPNFAALEAASARFAIEHGPSRLTGLSWQHISAGATPDALQCWSAVYFDKAGYRVTQPVSAARPFVADVEAKTVVFDAPYFPLDRAPNATGLVNWGAHDPGVEEMSRPEGLRAEIEARFGAYPAPEFIYAFTWPSEARTRKGAEALIQAMDRRADITEWLLAERLPDWQLAYVVVAEFHSAVEPFFHGVDPDHPLHGMPSAAPAREGMEGVHRAFDRMLGRLRAAFPDAVIAAFTPHGMAGNDADVLSMALLPELLYRRCYGRALYRPRPHWTLEAVKAGELPTLGEDESWTGGVIGQLDLPLATRIRGRLDRERARLRESLFGSRKTRRQSDGDLPDQGARTWNALNWMPAACYAPFWAGMDAFATPAFYDGRIRINLKGREARGRVDPARYAETLAGLKAFLMRLVDPLTGEPAVSEVVPMRPDDPLGLHPTEADLRVAWRGRDKTTILHPGLGGDLGLIGPVPLRRPGGHTGGDGLCYVMGGPLAPGDYGKAEVFDIAPTIVALAGGDPGRLRSGRSMIDRVPA